MAERGLGCAIYTRKSSEEGLEQDFNSLDAQHEACLSYIASQRQEGWRAVEQRYDDGGFSGGTLERPGVRALLADVACGLIDVIVVYKVDRLTRSLADFAKLVELFDEKGVSFVSVTQQFNTTTSMGRLTLNVLLSFAQFEREVTGERIRDKIAVSKKKGLWMGGKLPLGYDPRGRSLVINDAEARTVRQIYQRYLALGCVRALKDELDRDGITGKSWINRKGERVGGKPLSRGALYHILRSPLYRGRISHKGEIHKGQHPPIIDAVLWKQVQQLLDSNRQGHKERLRSGHPSWLKGMLHDRDGKPFTVSHTAKAGRRYRYYLAPPGSCLSHGKRHFRIPAGEIEGAVARATLSFLGDIDQINEALGLDLDAHDREVYRPAAAGSAHQFEALAELERQARLRHMIAGATVTGCQLEICLHREALCDHLQGVLPGAPLEGRIKEPITLQEPIERKERGNEIIILQPKEPIRSTSPDPGLITAIARAQHWRNLLTAGDATSLEDIAESEGLCRRSVGHIIHLASLAPDIVQEILSGRMRPDLMRKDVLKRLPIDWQEQRQLLGYEPY